MECRLAVRTTGRPADPAAVTEPAAAVRPPPTRPSIPGHQSRSAAAVKRQSVDQPVPGRADRRPTAAGRRQTMRRHMGGDRPALSPPSLSPSLSPLQSSPSPPPHAVAPILPPDPTRPDLTQPTAPARFGPVGTGGTLVRVAWKKRCCHGGVPRRPLDCSLLSTCVEPLRRPIALYSVRRPGRGQFRGQRCSALRPPLPQSPIAWVTALPARAHHQWSCQRSSNQRLSNRPGPSTVAAAVVVTAAVAVAVCVVGGAYSRWRWRRRWRHEHLGRPNRCHSPPTPTTAALLMDGPR